MQLSFLNVVAVIALAVVVLAQATPSHLDAESHNPVARVVEMLKALSTKLEADQKSELELYQDFECWAKKTIEGKEASNHEAESKIEDLKQEIADLESGVTTLTSEKKDLEVEIKDLNGEIIDTNRTRKIDHKGFLLAEEEMVMGIAALKKAMAVLDSATKNYKDGVLLSVRAQVDQDMSEGGLASLQHETALINKAVELGQRVLTHADATFLRRMLTGQVPTVDWKKLNRKATFKMSYKARSSGIQEQLGKMLIAFNKTLKEARAKEVNDTQTYEELIEIKIDELLGDQDALANLAQERAAKRKTKQDCKDEMDALTQQIQDTKDFIRDTNLAVAAKYQEYGQRKALRMGEIEAISKAISILYNDDARDLMKKSYASQGYFFLQESASVHQSEVAHFNKAAATLRKLAVVTKDRRVLRTIDFGGNDMMKSALKAIDDLIETLKGEEETDLEKKEKCEKDRMEDTRQAAQLSRDMDEETEKVAELNQTIATLVAKIQAYEADIASDEANREQMKKQRAKENAKYKSDSADDLAAVNMVEQAIKVLKEFYTSNHLMLAQKKQVKFVARKAPPGTWEGLYEGATNQANGIFAALANLKSDIQGDMDKAKKEEADALAEYNKLDGKLADSIAADKETIISLKGDKGTAEESRKTSSDERDNQLAPQLSALIETIKKKQGSGCDYFLTNYKLRLSNRQVEIDGLRNAKLYLQGGQLSKTNPDRALKPGDAAGFVQHKVVQFHH